MPRLIGAFASKNGSGCRELTAFNQPQQLSSPIGILALIDQFIAVAPPLFAPMDEEQFQFYEAG